MELLFLVVTVLSLGHSSWAQTTPMPGASATSSWVDTFATVNYGMNYPTTPYPVMDMGGAGAGGAGAGGIVYNNSVPMQATTPYPWTQPQNGSYTGGGGAYAYSYTPPPYDTSYNAYSSAGSPSSSSSYSSSSYSSSPELDYLRQVINTLPRFKIEDVPVVLDQLRQKKADMAALGQMMTAQDMGQVLSDFQAQKAATSAAAGGGGMTAGALPVLGTSLGTTGAGSSSSTSSLLSTYMNALSAGGATAAATTDPLAALQNQLSGGSTAGSLFGGLSAGSLLGSAGTGAGTALPQTGATSNDLIQQLQNQLGGSAGSPLSGMTSGISPSSPLYSLMQSLQSGGPTAAPSPTSPLSNMLNLGGASPLSSSSSSSSLTSALSALLQPQSSATTNPLASLMSPGTSSNALSSLLQPGQSSAGSLDLSRLINSVTGPGAGVGASSLLGAAGGAGGSLLNSVLGGGSGSLLGGGSNALGGGSALDNLLGGSSLSGLGSLGNAIGPKPPSPRRSQMNMMIPAMALTNGMDGPWGTLAMAQAMRGSAGQGMGGIMRNPVFLYNMMTGGEMFSF